MSIYLIAFQYVPLVNKKREKDKRHGIVLLNGPVPVVRPNSTHDMWIDQCLIDNTGKSINETLGKTQSLSFDTLRPLHHSSHGEFSRAGDSGRMSSG
jgi:hypothetical protein